MILKSKEYNWVQAFFRNSKGDPFLITSGQEDIFRALYNPKILRVAVKASTQYGKSEIAAIALLMVAIDHKEKILIVAPSSKQAGIIMGKVIDHLFDHQYLTAMIDYSALTIERLKQERSKSRITFKNGSEIMMLTAEASSVTKESKNLMGFGASYVLVDESSLIPDRLFSKILRMVGGVEDGKLVQLGNPFEHNHFGKIFDSHRYKKISIDWHQALAEKRVTQEFLDEASETMSRLEWRIFYDCKFPQGGTDDGLIPPNWIENAVNQKGCEGAYKQSGLDVARFGRDKTIYIYRKGGVVERIEATEQMDTMEVVGWVREFLDQDVPDTHCTDIIGIGSGVHDRLLEVQTNTSWAEMDLVPINVGKASSNKDAQGKFFNLRAEIFWHLRELLKPNKEGHSQISIPDDTELKKELGELRYKYSSERKIKLEPKANMKKRLGSSPDKADALALAFVDTKEYEPELQIFTA